MKPRASQRPRRKAYSVAVSVLRPVKLFFAHARHKKVNYGEGSIDGGGKDVAHQLGLRNHRGVGAADDGLTLRGIIPRVNFR